MSVASVLTSIGAFLGLVKQAADVAKPLLDSPPRPPLTPSVKAKPPMSEPELRAWADEQARKRRFGK